MSDPVIDTYKEHVDRTLLLENLKLSPQQRGEKFERFMRLCFELRRNAKVLRGAGSPSGKAEGSS